MKKQRLGTTDLYVTPVAFGVLTMGGSQMDLPLEEGIVRGIRALPIRVYETFFENGKELAFVIIGSNFGINLERIHVWFIELICLPDTACNVLANID